MLLKFKIITVFLLNFITKKVWSYNPGASCATPYIYFMLYLVVSLMNFVRVFLGPEAMGLFINKPFQVKCVFISEYNFLSHKTPSWKMVLITQLLQICWLELWMLSNFNTFLHVSLLISSSNAGTNHLFIFIPTHCMSPNNFVFMLTIYTTSCFDLLNSTQNCTLTR